MDEQIDNAADDDQLEKAAEKERRLIEREENDLRAVLKTVEGRRLMWKTLGRFGVFTSSMTGDNYTFYKEGMRNAGLMLLTDIMDVDPNAYTLMAKEAKEDAI